MNKTRWIKDAVFYQIYPISFYDSDGDGMGDLKGITQKAGYLKDLGVNAVWLSPIYKSPFKDAGYDVSDYYAIDRRFGTMEDLKELIRVYHENGIRVILDMVFGHTSDKCEWFRKSAGLKRNKYDDYYIWSDTNFDGGGENLIFGMYYRDGGYYRNYYASQPALNHGFHDPKYPWQMSYKDKRLDPLHEEMLDIMRFYLDMGADGFRFDLAGHMVKDEPWDADDPEKVSGGIWFWNKILGTLRKEYTDKVYIAEWVCPQNSIGRCGFDMDFLTHDTPAYNELIRNEPMSNLVREIETGKNYFSAEGKGSMKNFADYVTSLYAVTDGKGYISAPSGSHDEIRVSTFKSPDVIKTFFAFILTFKNAAFLYYGDEIGITHNFNVSKDGGSVRTGTRTPMQWTNGKNRGFSVKKTTYLPVNNDKNCSVESQKADKDSVYNVVKTLIKVRKAHPCLNAENDQKFLETGYPAVYERTDGKETVRVFINPSDGEYSRECNVKEVLYSRNAVITGNTVILKKQSFAIVKTK